MKVNAAQRLLAENMVQYLRRLKKLGIEKLGQGSYSTVFQHPTDSTIIVKVLEENDPGYLKYLNFCQAVKNKYCPKIWDIRYAKFDSDWTPHGTSRPIVFSEKLEPISTTEFKKFNEYVCAVLGDPEAEITDRQVWKRLGTQTKDQDLAVLARFVYTTLVKNSSLLLDVHRTNFMRRGSQIVLIDPFAD